MVSVVVPVYNVSKYLADCMRSILAQNISDMEVILIDDGSTDNSGTLCDRYAAEYSCLKVIHQEKRWAVGGTEHRNRSCKRRFYHLC